MRAAIIMCVAAGFLLLHLTAGCAPQRYAAFPPRQTLAELAESPDDVAVRELPTFAGASGSALRWRHLLDAFDWAEIILIGEQHDDALGHAVQLAVVEDVLSHWPGSAVSMEMLERDEQILVDDFLEGIIDEETFVRLTFSENWAGDGTWIEWFQPIIDEAMERNVRVVAANAPRRYVRLARTDGYTRLRLLPAQRRAHFALPRSRNLAEYRQRFADVMAGAHGDDARDADAAHDPQQQQRIDNAFRSQLLWDATMADSIVKTQPRRSAKVVHLVGQFHSDFDGGLVQEIRARKPRARILTISMQRAWRDTLRESDRSRADIVIYTGERPPKEDGHEPTAASPQVQVPQVHRDERIEPQMNTDKR